MDKEYDGQPIELVESDSLQETLRAAQLAAWERDHNHIEGLHFLYALLEGDNIVSVIVRQLLARKHMVLIDLMGDIDKELGRGLHACQSSTVPFGLEAALMLRYAESKALTTGIPTVYCEQLMLGIFHEGGDATRLLNKVGISEASFKKALRAILP